MKFLQLFPLYGEYFADFEARHPGVAALPYAEQNRRLVEDGFGIVHMFGRYLGAHGFETELVFPDYEPAQRQWLAERGGSLDEPADWRLEIAARQVDLAKPDILYLTEPVSFDARFLQRLRHRPQLVIAWKAAAIPAGTDWRGIDLLLSNFSPTFARALELGARRTEFFTPGFPGSLADELPSEEKSWDVSFIGSISSEHHNRTAYLNGLAKAQLTRENDFSLGYFLRTAEPAIVPVGVALHNRGACWGREMHRVLKGSRIALNVGIDLAKGETGNMRMIEATGLGTFLLTEYQDNIRKYFAPGVEIETFASQGELEEKVRYYLANERAREAIAKRGQERCQRDFSMTRSVERLAGLIRKGLEG